MRQNAAIPSERKIARGEAVEEQMKRQSMSFVFFVAVAVSIALIGGGSEQHQFLRRSAAEQKYNPDRHPENADRDLHCEDCPLQTRFA